MSVMQETQKIAAVVLFKDLHAKRMDVYDVLAAFISNIIIKKGLAKFSAVDMERNLVEDFGFDSIPQNVIKKAIKRTKLTELKDGFFLVKRNLTSNMKCDIASSFKEEMSKNDDIIKGICEYIEKKRCEKLGDREREEIMQAFCTFLLDSKCEKKYIADVAAYIISLDGTPEEKRIEEITEGVYQYTALTYNEDISRIEKLKNNITIFLDTEALISFGGFHGEIHKRYIDEMLQLISEINEKTHKKCMSIKYMDYVREEVDHIFSAAMFYVQGKSLYMREAVESIAEGCRTEEDVMEKKANLYACLKAKGIVEFAFPDRYSSSNDRYNLEGDDALKELITEDVTEQDIEKGAKRVSDINKLRHGGIYKNFEDIKYIFVSDNSKVQAVSTHFSKQLGCYHFVMGCSSMTNILWLKMNKGFAKSALPSSLEAITRSRVVVSSITSAKMRNEMKIMSSKIESGELESGALYEMLEDFKNYAKRPEDITPDSLDSNIHYIESEMKTYGEELSLYKSKVESEKKKRGEVSRAFTEYKKMVEKRECLKSDKSEKEVELEGIKKRKRWAHVISIAVELGLVLIFAFGIVFLISLFIKVKSIEWIANRVWIIGLVVSLLFIGISVIKGKRIEKLDVVMKIASKIDKMVSRIMNVTSEQQDNCESQLEGIENEILEAERRMNELRLQTDMN